MKTKQKVLQRKKRHKRIRKKVLGVSEQPRLTIFRSNKYISCQLIDDLKQETICAASSKEKELREKLSSTKDIEACKTVGRLIAERAKERGIKKVVFDRSGYKYHGRIKAFAEAAREAGLEF